ncbi:hypothetical protein NC653_034405 [Populus alba x Populus x berolinensis]|uniref:Uncharacterized protein n=1 Tax=Populus alba x Populus x berolinensis TaxID=444605 RepID=A0AAD6LNS2_9ROSI|nr:hypothetical protein NC653_034405 [Populus alba x Populus x berolinensis]
MEQQPKHIPFEFTSAWHHAFSGCSRMEGKKKYQSNWKETKTSNRRQLLHAVKSRAVRNARRD